MFWYIFVFVILCFFMMLSYQVKLNRNASVFIKFIVFVCLLLFIGLRHEVGGDWGSYLRWYKSVASQGISFNLENVILEDWGYNFLNWISYKLNLGIYGVNIFCAFIFLMGLFSFLNYLGDNRKFYTGLLISYPYLIMVVANGYTRQSVALGLIFLVYTLVLKGKEIAALIPLLVAFSFHKTSAIGFMAFLFGKRKKIALGVGVLAAVIGVVLFSYLQMILQRYYEFYIGGAMTSEGGAVRAVMNLVPAVLFIFLYRPMEKRFSDSPFWLKINITIVALCPFAFLKFTFADRLLLYFSMIQPLVFSRLERVLKEFEVKSFVIVATIFVYTLSMVVWLLFAVHRNDWIPYQNYLMLLVGL